MAVAPKSRTLPKIGCPITCPEPAERVSILRCGHSRPARTALPHPSQNLRHPARATPSACHPDPEFVEGEGPPYSALPRRRHKSGCPILDAKRQAGIPKERYSLAGAGWVSFAHRTTSADRVEGNRPELFPTLARPKAAHRGQLGKPTQRLGKIRGGRVVCQI